MRPLAARYTSLVWVFNKEDFFFLSQWYELESPNVSWFLLNSCIILNLLLNLSGFLVSHMEGVRVAFSSGVSRAPSLGSHGPVSRLPMGEQSLAWIGPALSLPTLALVQQNRAQP